VIEKLRTWWQCRTGEEETPFDGDTPAWFVSLLFHLVAMALVTVLLVNYESNQVTLTLTTPEDELEEFVDLPEEFYFDTEVNEDIGANSVRGTEVAFAEAPEISEISAIPNPDMPVSVEGIFELQEEITQATALHVGDILVKGAAGVGTTGAVGAIDRITHEILLSLEKRKTLVVWLFDESGSLERQRKEINTRFDRIYEELGVIEASGNPEFSRHEDKPLLTSVVSFGENVSLLIPKPTDNLGEIKDSVASIQRDESGVERVFSAVYMAAEKFRSYRKRDEAGEPERNVMFVVFSDEVGDDQEGLEQTIQICRRYQLPTYVVGVPAPFGRKQTLVKWVDPDPEYDQRPQWGQVTQGPESLYQERVKLRFRGGRDSLAIYGDRESEVLDSGFGPFALTRLCVETGGIYFTVHPNRNVNREISRRETAALSAHFSRFFDPQVMRRYRPDYVSAAEYERRVMHTKSRAALVQAAKMAMVEPMDAPRTRFEKESEADLANKLTEAQKSAAKLEPKIQKLYDTLKLGESDRGHESIPRWKAGYDLAMGRVMATKVRTETYNAMLAQAKQGLKFQNEKNDTWTLKPANSITVGSQLSKMADRAEMYLNRVVDEHPGTPWALLAQRELKSPLGWGWTESYTGVNAPRENINSNDNPPPPGRNDERRMLNKPKPRRPPPKL